MLLPAHWQTAAVLLGVWYIGAEVVIGPGEADIAMCTADRFADAEAAVGPGEIAVLSLDPFGKPVADLPIGVTDYATSVRVHGDQVVAERRQARRWTAAQPTSSSPRQPIPLPRKVSRQKTGCCRPRRWDTADELIANFLAVLAAGASLVLVANPDPASQERRRQTEKITRG